MSTRNGTHGAADVAADAPAAIGPASDTERIGQAFGRLRRVFAAKPEAAQGGDAPATATLVGGLVFEVAGPHGYRVRTDMPAPAGGAETAPTPGWYLRAAMGACTATLVTAYAAERGIALDLLQVTVSSRSDKRGMLGMDGVSPASTDLRTDIRLAAAGVPEAVLREIAERALRCSPVGSTIARGDAGTSGIEVIG